MLHSAELRMVALTPDCGLDCRQQRHLRGRIRALPVPQFVMHVVMQLAMHVVMHDSRSWVRYDGACCRSAR